MDSSGEGQRTESTEQDQPKRGRPAIGSAAMSAAERKRRSRAQQKLAGLQSTARGGRIPTPFSCELDAVAQSILRKAAAAAGLTIPLLLEKLISENL